MLYLYNLLFYQPIFNLLISFYNLIPGHDIGIAIIALTFLIRLILFPVTLSSLKSQKALQNLQPKIQEIKEKYKNEPEKKRQALIELYSKEKVKPLSSCLPLFIQLPIFVALYQVLIDGLKGQKMELLYSFIPRPEAINPLAFGFLDLSRPNFVLAFLAGLTQFWLSKRVTITKQPNLPGAKDEALLSLMNRQMLYFMPFLTIMVGSYLPGGLTLYWLTTNVFTGIQQELFLKRKKEE
jgi:YidC/Oxa1 family membrane protein insertase